MAFLLAHHKLLYSEVTAWLNTLSISELTLLEEG